MTIRRWLLFFVETRQTKATKIQRNMRKHEKRRGKRKPLNCDLTWTVVSRKEEKKNEEKSWSSLNSAPFARQRSVWPRVKSKEETVERNYLPPCASQRIVTDCPCRNGPSSGPNSSAESDGPELLSFVFDWCGVGIRRRRSFCTGCSTVKLDTV